MTELFLELQRKLSALPQKKQELWVSHFLDELSTETPEKNGHASEEQWIGGRRPTREEIIEAVDKLTKLSEDATLGDDLTLKDLINEGRRY